MGKGICGGGKAAGESVSGVFFLREGADESFAGKTNENGCKFGKAGEIPEQLEVVFKSFSKTDAWVDDACFCGDADLSCS